MSETIGEMNMQYANMWEQINAEAEAQAETKINAEAADATPALD